MPPRPTKRFLLSWFLLTLGVLADGCARDQIAWETVGSLDLRRYDDSIVNDDLQVDCLLGGLGWKNNRRLFVDPDANVTLAPAWGREPGSARRLSAEGWVSSDWPGDEWLREIRRHEARPPRVSNVEKRLGRALGEDVSARARLAEAVRAFDADPSDIPGIERVLEGRFAPEGAGVTTWESASRLEREGILGQTLANFYQGLAWEFRHDWGQGEWRATRDGFHGVFRWVGNSMDLLDFNIWPPLSDAVNAVDLGPQVFFSETVDGRQIRATHLFFRDGLADWPPRLMGFYGGEGVPLVIVADGRLYALSDEETWEPIGPLPVRTTRPLLRPSAFYRAPHLYILGQSLDDETKAVILRADLRRLTR